MRTIIFDFGNVIGFFDHDKTLSKVRAFTSLGRDAMYQSVYAGELEDLFEKGLIDELEFLQRVVGLWQLKCPEDFLAQAVADIFHPNPEVCELIPHLAKRYRLLLGSNTNILHARKFQEQFAGILGHFDRLVLSYEVGVRKPHVDFFRHCLRHAEAEAGECVFIDDLAANIEGARQVGMRGLLYREANVLKRELIKMGVDV